jgi:hypothetical protein
MFFIIEGRQNGSFGYFRLLHDLGQIFGPYFLDFSMIFGFFVLRKLFLIHWTWLFSRKRFECQLNTLKSVFQEKRLFMPLASLIFISHWLFAIYK